MTIDTTANITIGSTQGTQTLLVTSTDAQKRFELAGGERLWAKAATTATVTVHTSLDQRAVRTDSPVDTDGWNPVQSGLQVANRATTWFDSRQMVSKSDQQVDNHSLNSGLVKANRGSDATAVDTNDPFFADHDGATHYIWSPVRSSTNYIQVADEAALDITGDIDLRYQTSREAVAPAAGNQDLISKVISSGNFSYELGLLTSGKLQLLWSEDGTATITADSFRSTIVFLLFV